MADTNTYTTLSSTRKVVSKTEFDAMDKTGIPVGTEYDIVGEIEKTDLSTELQSEIDGKIDKPATDGTSGQVLTMGTDGKAKWADIEPSEKTYYRHNIYFYSGPPDGFYLTISSSNQTAFTPSTLEAYLIENPMSSATGTLLKANVKYPIFQISGAQDSINVSGISSTSASTTFNTASLKGSDTVFEI